MRVVIDTNILISGIFWNGPPRKVLINWLEEKDDLLITIPILSEYRTVLSRICAAKGSNLFNRWNRYLTELSILVEPKQLPPICRDPADDVFLEAAIGGRANVIISGDKDLLSIKSIEDIPIITAKHYIELR